MINLSTNIAGVDFDSCICNASGPKDATLPELEHLGRSETAAIMMKSCTLEPREGNPEPRYAHLPFGLIQSMGLPNLGYKKYIEFSTSLQKYRKPIIASIAGLCEDDYLTMVEAFMDSDTDLLEVNLSCPNIVGKPQVAYDLEQTENILKKIKNISGDKPVGVKLPPFYDLVHFQQIAELLVKYDVKFISCINSIGNTLFIDYKTESPIIKPKKGLGGLSGDYIKPIALANVRIFYDLIGDKVDIFGVGGVSKGSDVFEFLLAGASAVQVGTIFEKEEGACFARIKTELKELMQEKGYDDIQQIKGNLKFLT